MKKNLFIIALFLTSALGAFAQNRSVEICIVEHDKNSNSFKIEVSMYATHDDGLKYLVSRGSSWIGEQNSRAPLCPGSGCSAAQVGEMTFCTDASSPNCLSEYMTPAISDAIQQQINELIEGGAAARGLSETKRSVEILAYPNPAHNFIRIKVNNSAAHLQSTWLYIYDAKGKVQYQYALSGATDLSIITDSYPIGAYRIVLTDEKGNELATVPFMKQ